MTTYTARRCDLCSTAIGRLDNGLVVPWYRQLRTIGGWYDVCQDCDPDYHIIPCDVCGREDCPEHRIEPADLAATLSAATGLTVTVEALPPQPRTLYATVTTDHLFDNDPDGWTTMVGDSFPLGTYNGSKVRQLQCEAWDDDGEHYLTLRVDLPHRDDDTDHANEVEASALDTLLVRLGTDLGVTSLSFPGHPELRVG